jgi:CheY-like chemotaxis protein
MRTEPAVAYVGPLMTPRKGPVLVVDDEPHIRAFVELALEDEGYSVLTAADGAEALEALRTARPSIILLDLRMPGMDGQTFVETYRGTGEAPPAPIVVLTASRVPVEEAEALGVEGILHKPFDVEALLQELARHLSPQ